MGLADASAINLTLAIALLDWNQRRGAMAPGVADNSESTRYYLEALKGLSRRLNDPVKCTSTGVIVTIIGCLCHDVSSLSDY